MKIKTKFTVVTVLVVGITVFAIAGGCLYMFKKTLESEAVSSQESRIKTFWELLYRNGRDVHVDGDKLMFGNHAVNGDNEAADKLKELCGGTATIFMGDTRVATNVLKPDGSRAVGTKLTGSAYDAVIRDGKPYRGEAVILGIP